MKRQVVEIKDLEELSPIFKGEAGHRLARIFMDLFAINRINKLYENSCEYKGAEFAARLLNDLGVQYDIGNVERLRNLPKGAFISISNHPYGGLDGIMLIDLMAGIRSDFKLMVNKVLSLIEAMEENFISVTPVTDTKPLTTANINSIRGTIAHLQNGHPVGFFPSGAVSDYSLKAACVRDREWQESILKLIKKAKVPIVPIHFIDMNSPLFYFLGLIYWKIRLMRMPYEIFNKSKHRPRIGIGDIISVEEQEQYADIKSFGTFLRKAVYGMAMPTSYTPRTVLNLPGRHD